MSDHEAENIPVTETAPPETAHPEPAGAPAEPPVEPEAAVPPAAEQNAGVVPPVPAEHDEPVSPPAAAHPAGFWVRPGWLAVALVGLASSCLSVVLTLGILGLINRGLAYAAPADVAAVQAQVDTLQTRLDGVAQDLAGLRARVEQLEELAARTTALERMALDLQGEIDKRVAQAEELQGAVTDMQARVAEMVTQSKAFQIFADGLKELLDKLPKGLNP